MSKLVWSCIAPVTALALLAAGPAPRAQEPPRVIEVTAKRYDFEPSTVEVRQGERVTLRVRSADRLHGFGIENFGIAAEVPRGGEPVDIELVATEAGTFPIICTEDCGRGHDDMRGTLVVRAVAP